MSYIVLARKYRPQTFEDIVGQPHITTTLKNAIQQKRVAHSYLFTGPRGVGKTTTARIFAKALNCVDGPTPKPCNTCQSCEEIVRGSSVDILEIDGASNRGIDEIRNLRESVKFAPSKGRYKIYIIDEVHMLTPEAFNALLKTLEEPPPHVKFIFATTQAYKVPATILSRCQRFDFRRVSTKDVLETLKKIANKEKLEVTDEALVLIAKRSEGSLRDAEVVLDQIVSFTQGRVSGDDVTKILGVVGDDMLFGLSASLRNKDAISALRIVDELVNDGKDITQAVLALIEHFRHMAIAKISRDLDGLIDAPRDTIDRYEEESKSFTMENILYIVYTLSNTVDLIRKTSLSRVPLEASLIKLTRRGSAMPLNELIEKIEKMERVTGHCQTEKASRSPDKVVAEGARETRPIDPPAAKVLTKEDGSEGVTIEDVLNSWPNVISHIKSRKISIASYLEEGSPVDFGSGSIIIGFPKELQFHREVLESPENRRIIEEAIKAVLNMGLKVAFKTTESGVNKRTGQEAYGRDGDDPGGIGPREDGGGDVDPIVKSALEIFNGEVAGQRQERKKPK